MTISVRRPGDPSPGGPICGCFVQLPPITVLVDRRATTPPPSFEKTGGGGASIGTLDDVQLEWMHELIECWKGLQRDTWETINLESGEEVGQGRRVFLRIFKKFQ